METPPRAWGRLGITPHIDTESRNTPTSVGKTFDKCRENEGCRKHPHERGEDPWRAHHRVRGLETPPRAWGRLGRVRLHQLRRGNTPTSVGKTLPRGYTPATQQKHPHERGEDSFGWHTDSALSETPPRAWGRHGFKRRRERCGGNTPTSVGKTWTQARPSSSCRKHPHERGEDSASSAEVSGSVETPPRAWGRHDEVDSVKYADGNTPTSVGKT